MVKISKSLREEIPDTITGLNCYIMHAERRLKENEKEKKQLEKAIEYCEERIKVKSG